MHKISMLLIIFLFIIHSVNANRLLHCAEYIIKADFREDHIDYDDREKKFFRESLEVLLSRDSSFNITHMYLDETDDHRHTFSLQLWDISPYFQITAGNYNVNFGSGLLIGKKRYISPDLFASSLKTSYYNEFVPVKSGNPIYAFYGFGAVGIIRSDDITFCLDIFYSIRNRYISNEEYENGIINGSLSSVNGNLDMIYSSNEPVAITDIGGMIKLRLLDCFNFQIYFLTADLKSSNGKNILWDYYRDDSFNYGYDNYFGYGSYLQYRDDYVVMFIEYAISVKDLYTDNMNKNRIKDYGYKYGSSISHKLFKMLLEGKNTGNMFHAPYSSGNTYPERSWKFNLSCRPLKVLTAGSSFSSDRKISPSKYDSSLSAIWRERIFLSYRYAGLLNAGAWLSRIYHDSGGSMEKRYQIKSVLKMNLSDNLKANLRGVYQKSEKLGNSGNTGVGISIRLIKFIKLNISYYKFFISRGNSIYEKLFADRESVSNGSLFERSINRVESKIQIKYRKIYFSVKYENQFIHSDIISEKIQFSLKMII